MNRHQRRALAKIGGKTSALSNAAGQLQGAVHALQAVQNLEALPEQIREAHGLMVQAHTMVSALVEDCQGVADELEALKAMVFELVGPTAEDAFQKHLAKIQASRTQEPPG